MKQTPPLVATTVRKCFSTIFTSLLLVFLLMVIVITTATTILPQGPVFLYSAFGIFKPFTFFIMFPLRIAGIADLSSIFFALFRYATC